MNLLSQAWRMTWRDWRAGELRLLIVAMMVAVAAVTSVGFFADRIQRGFDRDAAQWLGGDIVVVGDLPLPADYAAQAAAWQLRSAQTVVFPSMAIRPLRQSAAEQEPRAQLSSIKAVSDAYPLRGAVRVAERNGDAGVPIERIPSPGTVWIDPQLIGALDVQVGDPLKLGDRVFQIERLIAVEPDRGAAFINFAPRVLMRLDELSSTGLIQPASRATYQLLMTGAPDAVRRMAAWLKPKLSRGQRVQTLHDDRESNGRPEMSQTLNRAQSFLGLVTMLTVLLAAVAIALAARQFSQRHTDACAVMRCLGSSQNEVTTLFMMEFLAIAVVGSLLGGLLGYATHFLLLDGLGRLINADLPAPSMMPAIQGISTGLALLIGFAGPPLLQLRQVPPLHVLRRDVGPPNAPVILTYGLGAAAFVGLLLWFAGDVKLGLIAGGGFIVALALFASIAWGALRLSAPLRSSGLQLPVAFRFALAGATRRQGATIVQVVSLAIGLMALLLLTLTRTDLLASWRDTAPADAPNRFVINIQPDQRDAFNAALTRAGLPAQQLLPMVRGRLVAINDKPIELDQFEGRAKRLIDREFNLSYMTEPPAYNRIIEGAWFPPNAAEISVEDGLMNSLNLKLGDQLRFDIAGQLVTARISSRRSVEWNSLRVNFFVIFPPALLETTQQSFITSFHVPDEQDVGPRLSAEFPNITVVDIGSILRQIQAVLDQVVAAVEFLFAFTLAAGVLVLYAALAASRDERIRETALLRALGASRQQLSRAQLLELTLIGALAGLLASAAASAIGWALAKYAFELSLRFNPLILLSGVAGGVAIAAIGGWIGLRAVLNQPPLISLREA